MFLFDVETHNNEKLAQEVSASLFDVNCLCERWDRHLTSEEIQTERKHITVINKSCGNPVMNMLEYI